MMPVIYVADVECAQPGCRSRFVPERSSDKKCPDHRGKRTRKTAVVTCPGCGMPHIPFRVKEFLPDRCEACSRGPFVKYGLGRLHAFQTYDDLCRFMRQGPMSRYFVGVDGEGTGAGKDHKYVLLGLGDREPLIDREGIRLGDALQYLYSQYHRNAIYASFYFVYDLSQLLREVEWDRAKMVFTHEGVIKRQRRDKQGRPIPHAAPYPMEFFDHMGQRWQFDVLEGKARRIRFRPRSCDCTRTTKGIVHPDTDCAHMRKVPWFVICDVAEFFADTFLNIVESDNLVATPAELRILREGKAARNTAELDTRMILYNQTENILLARIMGRVRTALAGVGIWLDKDEWYGMGQAAQKWMDRQSHVLTRDDFLETRALTREVFDIAQASYYGGLIENVAHGIVPGETWCYDRCSAYCADMAHLPCLYHAEFKTGTGKPGPLGPGRLRLEHVTVAAPYHPEPSTGPLQYRDEKSGMIMRPLRSSGWHWSDEIDAAEDTGLIWHRETDKWLEIIPRCDCPEPFADITKFYYWRKRCRKGTIEERVYKMLPSAVYGKLAQSAGESKYGNPLYASLITSRCRTEVLRALKGRLDDVVMIVQDAIYTRHRHTELRGNKLGQWKEDAEPIVNLTIVMPQFYYHDKHRDDIQAGNNPAMKARGVRTQDDRAQVVRQCDEGFGSWDDSTTWQTVKWPGFELVSDFDLTTPQQAAKFGNWSKCGQVRNNVTYRFNTHPGKKRETLKPGSFRYDQKLQAFVSRPYDKGKNKGNDGLESAPYSKEFGYMPNELDIENYGNTQNGPRGLELREVFR